VRIALAWQTGCAELEGLYMGAVRDFDEVIGQYHRALGEFVKGNPEPVQRLHSHREDVTIANPRGGIGHGWAQVAERLSDAASGRQGAELRFEVIEKHVTSELAYIVEMEWAEAKFAGKEEVSSYGLRATVIFRPEDGTWKVVHRHADPTTFVQPAAPYEVD
jgi:ketosteroid isomerase-like protein